MPSTAGIEGRLPVPLGEVLEGKYLVEGVLGAGGMGVVLRAKHLTLGQLVAIKMPLVETIADRDTVERLLREAKAAVRLRSEHVCRVLDVGQTAQRLPYIVLEYLEGIDLSALLRQKQVFAIERAIGYLLEICEAVGEAHALGIVHRDLKPHNMFLVAIPSGRKSVKVLDFGISKLEGVEGDHSLTTSAVILGSPSYIAPEQMASTRSATARSDVWSLGVCLYQFVTGRLPFVGASLMDLAVRIATDSIIPPSTLRPEISPELEAVIMRCLDREPKNRYADARELGAALAECAPPELARAFAADKPSESSMHVAGSAPPDEADISTTLRDGPPGEADVPSLTQTSPSHGVRALVRTEAGGSLPPIGPRPLPSLTLASSVEPPRVDAPRASDALPDPVRAPEPRARKGWRFAGVAAFALLTVAGLTALALRGRAQAEPPAEEAAAAARTAPAPSPAASPPPSATASLVPEPAQQPAPPPEPARIKKVPKRSRQPAAAAPAASPPAAMPTIR
jgi:eukaryotic-like serine/threonine-protein kinase